MRCKAWSRDHIELLERLYADTDTAILADMLDRAPQAIFVYAGKLGLKKSAEYMIRLRRKKADTLLAANQAQGFAGQKLSHPGSVKIENRGHRALSGGIVEIRGNVTVHRMGE